MNWRSCEIVCPEGVFVGRAVRAWCNYVELNCFPVIAQPEEELIPGHFSTKLLLIPVQNRPEFGLITNPVYQVSNISFFLEKES